MFSLRAQTASLIYTCNVLLSELRLPSTDVMFSLRAQTASLIYRCNVLSLRAPVLVAIALIELGMKYEDAVEMIRQ